MIRPPPRSTRTDTLFPFTTLFRSVASATASALMGLDCVVFMGEVDMDRQALNVFRMRLLGAEVRPAMSGSRTLKAAVNEAMRDWVATVETSHYLLGSVMVPHPYPFMVRELRSEEHPSELQSLMRISYA